MSYDCNGFLGPKTIAIYYYSHLIFHSRSVRPSDALFSSSYVDPTHNRMRQMLVIADAPSRGNGLWDRMRGHGLNAIILSNEGADSRPCQT
jgi:hypothetical protein